ncbi:hypothetical protein OH779_40145 [Actinacidiphila glaucinigra]|uniref:hypothetical protein n=1 Tax=Actinacidiphila glaucinigra TaxID=235986 RepID=UPI00386CBD00
MDHRPDSSTEVTESLASLFDDHADPGRRVAGGANRWLRSGDRGPRDPHAVIHTVATFLLSTSAGISAFIESVDR